MDWMSNGQSGTGRKLSWMRWMSKSPVKKSSRQDQVIWMSPPEERQNNEAENGKRRWRSALRHLTVFCVPDLQN